MDLLDELSRIGFTEYEAKVYLELLRDNPATGYQISKESGVPRSMVYETLSRLHSRGIVLETIEGRATLYRPLPPQMLLAHHEAEHARLITDLKSGLEELYRDRQDDRVWSIEGRASAMNYAGQMIHTAERPIYLILNDQDLQALRQEIEAACARGLEVNTLLTGEGSIKCGRSAYHPPLESELQELTGLLLVAVENQEVLIASTSQQQTMRATLTRNLDLVLIARQFVWMELFTHRIWARIGPELLERLDPDDRRIFASLSG